MEDTNMARLLTLTLTLLLTACPSGGGKSSKDTTPAQPDRALQDAVVQDVSTFEVDDVAEWEGFPVEDLAAEMPKQEEVAEPGEDLAVEPDLEECEEGTVCNPILIPSLPYHDARNGQYAPSDEFDYYSPCAPETNETGPEFIYVLEITEPGTLHAQLDEVEGDGVDMDVHLLSDPVPSSCLARGHAKFHHHVEPGFYWIVVDTWVDSDGIEYPGPYELDVWLAGGSLLPEQEGFNKYVVDAINDGLKYPKDGTYTYCYNNSSCEPDVPIYFGMVHDGFYMGEHLFEGTGLCYCCGHTLEIFLDAYRRYQLENGVPQTVGFGGLTLDDMDIGPFYQHWFGWGVATYSSSGDAMEYAGIGTNIYPEDWDLALTGDFVEFSRTNGSGHSVIFVNWVEEEGEIAGIRYYSCNGGGHSHPDPDDPNNITGVSGPSFQTEMFSSHGGKVIPSYLFMGRAFDPATL